MTLSRTTEYALRTLAFMARSPTITYSCSTLHRNLHISEKYLQRILTDLTKHGLMVSARGRTGGYLLARNARSIYLYEIIEATGDLEPQGRCFFGFGSCPLNNRCTMHRVWADTHERLIRTLRKTRLSDLVTKHIVH